LVGQGFERQTFRKQGIVFSILAIVTVTIVEYHFHFLFEEFWKLACLRTKTGYNPNWVIPKTSASFASRATLKTNRVSHLIKKKQKNNETHISEN